MRKSRSLILVLCLAVAMVFSFAGCGDNGKDNSSDSEEQKTEMFSGELTDALETKIVVKSNDDILEFVTDDDTVYDLAGAGELTIGDTVDVAYHKQDTDKIADKVTITKQIEIAHSFEGTVNDINDNDIVVYGNSMTVHFHKDNNTSVKGKLTAGDKVKVVYTGDVSKHPYAKEIQVLKEAEQLKEYSINGTVSQINDKDVLIAIQSARAYSFKVTDKTKITGKDKKLVVGYMVKVKYNGDIDKEPGATEIEVISVKTAKALEINGTVARAKLGGLILKVGEKKYR